MASSPSKALSSNFHFHEGDSLLRHVRIEGTATTRFPEIGKRQKSEIGISYSPTLNYRTSYDLSLYYSSFSIVLRSAVAISRSRRSPKIGSWGSAFPRKTRALRPAAPSSTENGTIPNVELHCLSFAVNVTRSKGNPRVWRGDGPTPLELFNKHIFAL
jgi:hypothetical protein